MKKQQVKILTVVFICSLISACGVGQKKLLFTTRSNIGLDVDAKQFTAQLNIDRQEAVIGPTFEGGRHFPIAAAFVNSNRLLGGFGVSSLFSGGASALALSQSPAELTAKDLAALDKGSQITLTEKPVFHRSRIGKLFDRLNPFKSEDSIKQDASLPGPGEVKPFIFDTDTSLGIKLAWSGATGEFPDKVKIGFNREEFALAPVMLKKENKNGTFDIGIPSFFAALDIKTEFGSIINTNIGFRHVFAVGEPATRLAANPSIRAIVKKRFELVDSGLCLNKWLDPKANTVATAQTRLNMLNSWLTTNNIGSIEDLLNDSAKWSPFAAANITSGFCEN